MTTFNALPTSVLDFAVFAGLLLPVFYVLYVIIYRFLFHPLAGSPGPILAAITYWYDFYYDILDGESTGCGNDRIERLHEVYGPVVRINPDEISVKDPKWFDKMYNGNCRDKWLKHQRVEGSPKLVAEHHRMRRAPLRPFFSRSAVANFESAIRARADQFTDRIKEQYACKQKILHVNAASLAFTLEVISEFSFGQSWGCLASHDFASEWSMKGLFEPVPYMKQFPWINGAVSKLPLSLVRRMLPGSDVFFRANKIANDQVQRILADRNTEKSKEGYPKVRVERETVFDALLDSPLPDPEKTVQRLGQEACALIVSGGEPTSTAMGTAVYHLLENPVWLSKLTQELDTAMPDRNILADLSTLEKLPILSACIKESLRINTPITNRLQLIEPEDTLIQGRYIPAGTPVSMSILSVHMDPVIFEDPRTFDASRWMHESSIDLSKYLVAFSKGPRGCIGQNLAWAELLFGIAALFRRFELQLVDVVRERDVDIVRDCFVGMTSKKSKGVRVQVVNERS